MMAEPVGRGQSNDLDMVERIMRWRKVGSIQTPICAIWNLALFLYLSKSMYAAFY